MESKRSRVAAVLGSALAGFVVTAVALDLTVVGDSDNSAWFLGAALLAFGFVIQKLHVGPDLSDVRLAVRSALTAGGVLAAQVALLTPQNQAAAYVWPSAVGLIAIGALLAVARLMRGGQW